jgi:membrane associated rhomboid family serine protease
MTYTEKEYKQRISLGQSNNALTMLLIVNLVVFIIFTFLKVMFHFLYREDGEAVRLFNERILSLFILPASLSELALKPWTVVTSFFVQTEIWPMISHMLWLWTFGYIMQDLTGNRKIFPIFIYGGLVGAIGFLAVYNLVPSLQSQIPTAVNYGAASGVTGLVVATTMVSPGYRIFPLIKGGIPLWILTVLYFFVTIATIPSFSIAGYTPFLAGAFAGFLFMVLLRQGSDASDWMNNLYDWINNLFNPDKPKKGKNIKDELFYKSTSAPYTKTSNITQQRVDDILDKINQKGFNSLTAEEKELLERASKDGL